MIYKFTRFMLLFIALFPVAVIIDFLAGPPLILFFILVHMFLLNGY